MEATIYGTLRDGVEQLMAHGEETGRPQREWVEGLLRQVLSQLETVAGRSGIELVEKAQPAEVAMFFDQCQRTGLSPWARR